MASNYAPQNHRNGAPYTREPESLDATPPPRDRVAWRLVHASPDTNFTRHKPNGNQMGMFDWVHCDAPLPGGYVPAPESSSSGCGAAFQVHDLDNGLDVYRITKDGRLLFEKWGEWHENDRTGEFISFTGPLCLMGDERDFTAIFDAGRLVAIGEGNALWLEWMESRLPAP